MAGRSRYSTNKMRVWVVVVVVVVVRFCLTRGRRNACLLATAVRVISLRVYCVVACPPGLGSWGHVHVVRSMFLVANHHGAQ